MGFFRMDDFKYCVDKMVYVQTANQILLERAKSVKFRYALDEDGSSKIILDPFGPHKAYLCPMERPNSIGNLIQDAIHQRESGNFDHHDVNSFFEKAKKLLQKD